MTKYKETIDQSSVQLKSNKKCIACGEIKNLSEYYGNLGKRYKNGRLGQKQSRCKKCQCKYNAAFRISTPERRLYRTEKVRSRRKLVVGIIREAKSLPCRDCGEKYPYYVMDLDHRSGTDKKFSMGQAGRILPSIDVLKAEIDKCDSVCSNCHRERTFGRKQHLPKPFILAQKSLYDNLARDQYITMMKESRAKKD